MKLIGFFSTRGPVWCLSREKKSNQISPNCHIHMKHIQQQWSEKKNIISLKLQCGHVGVLWLYVWANCTREQAGGHTLTWQLWHLLVLSSLTSWAPPVTLNAPLLLFTEKNQPTKASRSDKLFLWLKQAVAAWDRLKTTLTSEKPDSGSSRISQNSVNKMDLDLLTAFICVFKGWIKNFKKEEVFLIHGDLLRNFYNTFRFSFFPWLVFTGRALTSSWGNNGTRGLLQAPEIFSDEVGLSLLVEHSSNKNHLDSFI